MRSDVDTVFGDALRLDIHDLVRLLNENLGSVVVQSLTGVKDRGQPARWARGEATPRRESETQLRLGYRVWRILEEAEGRSVALAWILGSNPRLEEQTPVTAIRELRSADVIGAAMAFVDGAPAA